MHAVARAKYTIYTNRIKHIGAGEGAGRGAHGKIFRTNGKHAGILIIFHANIN